MTSSVPTGSFPHPRFGSYSTCILCELNMKTCWSFKEIYSNVWLIQCRLGVPLKVLLFQGWCCRCIYVLKMVKSNPPWLFFFFFFLTDTFKLCNASLLLYCNGTLLTDTRANILAFHHLSGCWKLQVRSWTRPGEKVWVEPPVHTWCVGLNATWLRTMLQFSHILAHASYSNGSASFSALQFFTYSFKDSRGRTRGKCHLKAKTEGNLRGFVQRGGGKEPYRYICSPRNHSPRWISACVNRTFSSFKMHMWKEPLFLLSQQPRIVLKQKKMGFFIMWPWRQLQGP